MKTVRLWFCLMLVACAVLPAAGQYSSNPPKAGDGDEKEPVIPGITIKRSSGEGYLGLELVDYNYKLTFYGQDKKPKKADYPRALLRWKRVHRKGSERYMLSLGSDGMSLESPRYVRPPYNFNLFITLLTDDPAKESENYTIMLRL